MSRRIAQSQGQVCQLCDFIISRSVPRKTPHLRKASSTLREFHTGQKLYIQNTKRSSATATSTLPPNARTVTRTHTQNNLEGTRKRLHSAFDNGQTLYKALLADDHIPSDEETIHLLKVLDGLAQSFIDTAEGGKLMNDTIAVSSLLNVVSASQPIVKKQQIDEFSKDIAQLMAKVSETAYTVIKHPSVFISARVLGLYIDIQAKLLKPASFPEVFNLYANKELPVAGTSNPIQYRPQNPNKVGNAIPFAIADTALNCAIFQKDLPAAIGIIEQSYSTTSFRRAKLLRRALVPFTGLAAAPVAAYAVASQLASMQSTMDTQLATNVAFTGLVAYIGFTATIGIVAITTANDQMERVTWSQGMPLRERWIREEERAAIDKVAQAWGFSEVWRRGEEEGAEWDFLREWVSERGMILDAAELMEGME